jgi:hypothetical protein
MKLSLRFVLVLMAIMAAAVLVLAVACGGDDEEEGPAAGETPAAAETPAAGETPAAAETPERTPAGEAGELPDIPAYPGATESFSGTFTGGGTFPIPMMGGEGIDPEDYGSVQYTMYETSDSFGDVVDFYKDEFSDWKEVWSFNMEQAGEKGEIVVWSKGGGDLAAWMAATEDEGTTSVIVAMGARQ